MQIDQQIFWLVLFGVVGAFWKHIAGWMGKVNAKLEDLRDQKATCLITFVSKKEFEQSKDHVWQKLREHDQLLLRLGAGKNGRSPHAGENE